MFFVMLPPQQHDLVLITMSLLYPLAFSFSTKAIEREREREGEREKERERRGERKRGRLGGHGKSKCKGLS